MNLVSKFTTLKINALDHIDPSDLEFCESMDKYFQALLQGCQELVLNLNEKFGGQGNEKASCIFRLDDFQESIESQVEDSKIKYLKAIVKHFNDRYSLSLKFDDAPDCDHYSKIVEWVLRESDGNLIGAGQRSLIEKFKHAVYRPENWKLQGRRLTIESFGLGSKNEGGNILAPLSEEQPQILLRALSFWKERSLTVLESMSKVWPPNYRSCDKIRIPGKIVFGFADLQEVEFYKNRRLDIVFGTATQAHDFTRVMELHTQLD